MKSWKCRIAVGLLFGGIQAQVSGADLLEVYRAAQENDPVFQAARYEFEAAREKIPQVRAGLLPTLSLSGSDDHTHGSASFDGAAYISRGVHAWTWTLRLTQPLFRLDKFIAYREAGAQFEAAVAQYAQAEQALTLRVSAAYLAVLAAQKNIEVAQTQRKAATEQLALAQHGYEAGTHAVTDVHEDRSRAELARAELIAAQNELEVRRAELEKIIGQVPETLTGAGFEKIIPRLQPEDATAWIAQARENNPSVLAPQATLRALELDVGKTRAEYLPTLDMVAAVSQNYSSSSLATPSSFASRIGSSMAGVQLTMPLYEGGATRSRVTEAIANRNRAAAELESARRQAATDARQSYSAVVSGLARITALEAAVESGISAVEGNQAGYDLGIRMNIDVLDAQQQLYSAQRDLVQARYDTLLEGMKLKAVAGVLNETDVVMVNSMLVK